jgi:hypothetical protein
MLLLPTTCFGSIRAIFRLKYYLLKNEIYTVGNIVVDCEIYILYNLYTYITISRHNGDV